jgi:hypothetical protein
VTSNVGFDLLGSPDSALGVPGGSFNLSISTLLTTLLPHLRSRDAPRKPRSTVNRVNFISGKVLQRPLGGARGRSQSRRSRRTPNSLVGRVDRGASPDSTLSG